MGFRVCPTWAGGRAHFASVRSAAVRRCACVSGNRERTEVQGFSIHAVRPRIPLEVRAPIRGQTDFGFMRNSRRDALFLSGCRGNKTAVYLSAAGRSIDRSAPPNSRDFTRARTRARARLYLSPDESYLTREIIPRANDKSGGVKTEIALSSRENRQNKSSSRETVGINFKRPRLLCKTILARIGAFEGSVMANKFRASAKNPVACNATLDEEPLPA